VWTFSQAHLARAQALAHETETEMESETETIVGGGGDGGGGGAGSESEPARDTTEHLRRKLAQWCEKAVEKTTAEMESLETHSAVRNVMLLFDRIKDFEKRVLARQPELSVADREALIDALGVLIQMLGPFAPHLSEELWIALGNDGDLQTPWPGVSSAVPA
jgi:leucyl-tRNA synthetase